MQTLDVTMTPAPPSRLRTMPPKLKSHIPVNSLTATGWFGTKLSFIVPSTLLHAYYIYTHLRFRPRSPPSLLSTVKTKSVVVARYVSCRRLEAQHSTGWVSFMRCLRSSVAKRAISLRLELRSHALLPGPLWLWFSAASHPHGIDGRCV